MGKTAKERAKRYRERIRAGLSRLEKLQMFFRKQNKFNTYYKHKEEATQTHPFLATFGAVRDKSNVTNAPVTNVLGTDVNSVAICGVCAPIGVVHIHCKPVTPDAICGACAPIGACTHTLYTRHFRR